MTKVQIELSDATARASDDEVLALAAVSQADLIITGDADLLTLGSHGGIPIIDPAEAVIRIGGETS